MEKQKLSMRTIMILGANETKVESIRYALDLGLRVVVVDQDVNAEGFKIPGVIPEYFSICDTNNILATAQKYNISAILSNSEISMRTAGIVNDVLNLPGISEKCACIATNKSEQRRIFKENNIPSPLFHIVRSLSDFYSALNEYSEKCVLKIADGSGSTGIYMIDNPKDLRSAQSAFDYCMSSSNNGVLVLEEYMEGPEVCVETLNFNGTCYPIQVTDQLKKMPPYFIDSGYNQPSILPNNTVEDIKKVAIAANIAIGNTCGSSCTEIIVTKDGPKVVEIGARLAGDYMTSKLVPMSTGVNMNEGTVKIALGEEPDISPKWNLPVASRYYLKPVLGKIVEIKGVDKARNIKGVKEVIILRGVGEIATEVHHSPDRLAVVIAQGDTVEESIKICEAALDNIEFVTVSID